MSVGMQGTLFSPTDAGKDVLHETVKGVVRVSSGRLSVMTGHVHALQFV